MSQHPLARGSAVHPRLPTLLSQQQHRGTPLPHLEQHSEELSRFQSLGQGGRGQDGDHNPVL